MNTKIYSIRLLQNRLHGKIDYHFSRRAWWRHTVFRVQIVFVNTHDNIGAVAWAFGCIYRVICSTYRDIGFNLLPWKSLEPNLQSRQRNSAFVFQALWLVVLAVLGSVDYLLVLCMSFQFLYTTVYRSNFNAKLFLISWSVNLIEWRLVFVSFITMQICIASNHWNSSREHIYICLMFLQFHWLYRLWK